MAITLGNPAPFGLLAFGLTVMNVMWVEMGWVEYAFQAQIAGTAIVLGGAGQILVGILELFKGSTFSFAVFGCYGSYWLSWGLTFWEMHRTTSELDELGAFNDGRTLYYIQWGFLTMAFWIITWRKNMALVVVFGASWVTFFLLAASAAQPQSEETLKSAGYCGFIASGAALYTGIAELINEEWGMHVLPGLEPLYRPQQTPITSERLAQLISYNTKSNTLFLQFRNLQLFTEQDLKITGSAVEDALQTHGPTKTEGRVHVVVDYANFYVAKAISAQYWALAKRLEDTYYLSVTRFHVSSFGTQTGQAPPALPSTPGGSEAATEEPVA